MADSFDKKFALLKHKFENHAINIKKIYNFSKSMAVDNEDHLNIFRGMLVQLDLLFPSFNSINDQLVELCIEFDKTDSFPAAEDKKLIETVQQQFYSVSGKGESLKASSVVKGFSAADFTAALKEATMAAVAAANMAGANSNIGNSTASMNSKIKFPKIQLPSFDGDNLSDWPLFRDTYECLVHDEAYSNIEKFHFLTGSLKGRALDLIKHIQVSDDNYEQAWTLLQKHYDNKRKLASSYIHKLLDFRPCNKKSKTELLQEFLLNITENVTAFYNINIPNRADFILFELAIHNLDKVTREAFEVANCHVEFPSFESLKTFVESKYLALTMMQGTKSEQAQTNKISSPSTTVPLPNKFQPRGNKGHHSTILLASSKSKYLLNKPKGSQSSPSKLNCDKISVVSCFICNGPHTLRYCNKFHSASPSERLNLLRAWRGCKNCLHPSHSTVQCTSAFKCRECNSRHHTLLHLPTPSNSVNNKLEKLKSGGVSNIEPTTRHPEPVPSSSNTTLTAMNHTCDALLGTVQAFIKDGQGDYQPIRMVIDSGSQFSLITQDCVNRLGLSIDEFTRSIRGVGSCPAFQTRGKVKCTLRSRSTLPALELSSDAVVVPIITNTLPQVVLPFQIRQMYSGYNLADPHFWKPGPIDYLLGADQFCEIISGLPITLSSNNPQLLNTIFGYVIIGKLPELMGQESMMDVSLGVTSSQENIEQIMNQFWELEEVNVPVGQLSPDEMKCEEHFLLTHYRLSTGRYVVSYPFKLDPPPSSYFIGSKQQALNRLFNLEQKFRKFPGLREEYNLFMRDYAELGHMRIATSIGEYYIPHHPVFKLECGKPKIRVVFDASSKSKHGSLNDHLLTGPKLHNDIGVIILRFRRHPIVFTCDIVKMYRQILINPNECKYQHIVWRFSEEEPVTDWELLTVTYGTAPAPYQSLRTVEQLITDEGENYPLAVEVIKHDRYIDDLCSGASSIEEVLELKRQVIGLLKAGEFSLSKWTSNDPMILSDVSSSSLPVSWVDTDHSVKILGLQWDPKQDEFSYTIDPPKANFTKRAILSAIGKIYDPLGYISPVIFFAKVILQETWKSSLGWDDEVPEHLKRNWQEFITDLPNLSLLKIPRHLQHDEDSHCEAFGFCDASSKGFCASIYLRFSGIKSNLYLLKSKTRLSPIKPLTIPRLELNAALLLAQLYSSIKTFLDHYSLQRVTLFTDATIVLCWLHTPPYRLKTYIANRIVRILDVTKIEWWVHVPTRDNPADCGSRGLLPSQLTDHSLWWSGPSWIHCPRDTWPTSFDVIPQNELPELKSEATTLATTSFPSDWVSFTERFSSYIRMVNVFGFILRFKTNSLNLLDKKLAGSISYHEFQAANRKLISCLQQYYYPDAYGETPKWSQLLISLGVFIDDVGLLRVGGRLSKSQLPYNQKHPILLPRRSHFTNILIDHYHKMYLHVGPSALHAIINRTYWIPSAKSLIKQRTRLCITCLKFSKHQLAPRMGDLPSSRFNEFRAFFSTGVDFAGPFLVRESNRRKAPLTKAYLCLFVCLSTKALHLELSPSLSTEAFLDAFERFISRRGLPSQMVSDRGSNFIGASNYLKEINKWLNQEDTRSLITEHGSQRGIHWSFNSPASPHLGGIYEAGVKSVKSLLVKTLGGQPYLSSELSTMFSKIEAVLNSRPLYSMSTDPSDLQPLTPGHFLIGGPLTSIPEIDLTDVPANRLSHWQVLRSRVQTFWKRWRNEYLSTLQRRNKWLKSRENLKVGDLVYVTDMVLPAYQWPLARIVDVHPGDDGVVRVATIKTAKGIYKRPAVKLLSLQPITEPIATDKTNCHYNPLANHGQNLGAVQC